MDTCNSAAFSSSDVDVTRWCTSHISGVAAVITDSSKLTCLLDSALSIPSTIALISQFACGHRANAIFVYISSDMSLCIEDTLPQPQQCPGTCMVVSRASSSALNPNLPWHEQIITTALQHASVIDSLHALLNRSIRPLLDMAACVPHSSKHLPKVQAQLSDLCSTLRLCVGSKRAEPVDFDRALVSHAALKDALASHAADSLFSLLSGGDRQIQEDVKTVLLEWTADMRRLDDMCKDPACTKLSELEQHFLSVHAAVTSTLATTNNPHAAPSRLVDVCVKHMDRDSAFRILCRMPKANFEQARLDLSARAKVADSTVAALRDFKIEGLLSCGSIATLRAAMAPILKTLVDRGRENSSRSSQSAEFMMQLSYDVLEQVCSVLERTSRTSLLLLPRDE
jgi:hypothetical protein